MRNQYDVVVEELAVPHRRRAAERRLMAAGSGATPAVRRGLQHASADVRVSCCRILDHFLDEAAVPELTDNLAHPDPDVRAWALHALACDRCKEGACRPAEGESLPLAIQMLLEDPSAKVRYQALFLVATAVHRRPEVTEVVERVRVHDPSPVIRKVASWWVPGGARYERTRPRSARTTRQTAAAQH